VKRYLYIIWAVVLVAVLGTTGLLVFQGKIREAFMPKERHIHVGFVVFENNKKLDFSDFKYMSVKPCGLKETEPLTDAQIQDEKAHLHDNVGDVVHSHFEGAQWKDLFSNIKFPIDYAKTTGYINGQKVEDWKDQKIQAYDSLVVFIGNNDPKNLKQAVTKNHIQMIEKKSESCGASAGNH
jgi:hypothetical protein